MMKVAKIVYAYLTNNLPFKLSKFFTLTKNIFSLTTRATKSSRNTLYQDCTTRCSTKALTTQTCLSLAARFCCGYYRRYGETSYKLNRGKVKNNRYFLTCMLKHLTVVYLILFGKTNLSLLFILLIRCKRCRLFFRNNNLFMAGTNHSQLSKCKLHCKH